MSREYTEEEVREKFLLYMWRLIIYWEKVENRDCRRKLEGLMHSILATLDGEGGYLPGFKVIPDPHPNDKEYRKSRGENYYPANVDIAGSLHELFYANK